MVKKNKWLVAIKITMPNAQSEIQPLLNKLWTHFDENFRIAVQWYKENGLILGGDLIHHADSPN